MFVILNNLVNFSATDVEGVIALPNGLATLNTPTFMIDAAKMALFHL